MTAPLRACGAARALDRRSAARRATADIVRSVDRKLEEFGELFGEFVRAALDAESSKEPAFRALLRTYMESAVAEVLSYSPHDAVVPDDLPVPRWGWDGLE